jgi:hypothetical protein
MTADTRLLALVMLAYTISLVVGEAIQDVQSTKITPQDYN